MASPPTANDIKTQLIALLTPVIGTSGTKKVKLLDSLPLAYLVAEGEDPTVLKSPLDIATLESGKTDTRVNCLMITELGFAQGPAQSDSTRRTIQPQGQNIITRRFGLAYVYQFGTGSEAIFSTNVELIRTTLNSNPKLGFATVTAGLAGQGSYIKDHGGLQMPLMLPAPFSGIICHSAEGILTVRVIEPLGSPS
jgi:hypothetical protein